MNQYWVLRNGKRSGPFDKTLLAASYDKGKLFPADLVSTDGKENWTPASEVFGLALGASAVMPPAPTVAPPASRPLESPYAPPTARIDREGSEADDAESALRRFLAAVRCFGFGRADSHSVVYGSRFCGRFSTRTNGHAQGCNRQRGGPAGNRNSVAVFRTSRVRRAARDAR